MTENGILVSIPHIVSEADIKEVWGIDQDGDHNEITTFSVIPIPTQDVTYIEVMEFNVNKLKVVLLLKDEQITMESKTISLSGKF